MSHISYDSVHAKLFFLGLLQLALAAVFSHRDLIALEVDERLDLDSKLAGRLEIEGLIVTGTRDSKCG